MSILTAAEFARYAMSFEVSWMVAGIIEAPILHNAMAHTQYSQRRRSVIIITTSPLRIPSFLKALAARLESSEMSVKVNSRSSPASLIHTRAFLSGSTRAHSADDVIGEVEVLGHVDLEVVVEILVLESNSMRGQYLLSM